MVLEEYQRLKHSDFASVLKFINQVEIQPSFSSTAEKSSFLELLLKDLQSQKEEWTEELKTKALSVIRILGRDQVGSDPLFTKQGMVVFIQLAGLDRPNHVVDTLSSQEALKCICNCIFLKESVKPYLEEEHVVDSCLHVLQYEDHPLSLETQFLTCRILFFLTVHRSDLVESLVKANISAAIAKILSANIAQLEDPISRIKIDQHAAINPLTVTSEALKLLFNLMLVEARSEHATDTNQAFIECLDPILRLIFIVPYAEPQPLVPPHSQAIHALMQFQFATIDQVWSEPSHWTQKLHNDQDEHGYQYMATTLVDVLDKSIHVLIPSGDPDQDGSQSIDAAIAPLLLVLVSLAEGNETVKQAMVKAMLPREKDRLKPVHEGFGLPAYLIRLMTSTMMPQTRDAVCETLFALCNKDANQFAQQVGYGNAVGFLVNKGIAMETPVANEQEAEEINPITGQYVSKEEKLPDLKDMTDEEKEREAERLFVLFERLKKTGIIDVENPIAKAMQESQGRFEEIYSDSDSD